MEGLSLSGQDTDEPHELKFMSSLLLIYHLALLNYHSYQMNFIVHWGLSMLVKVIFPSLA